ncbi:MAG: hypothetical protein ABJC60_03760 [Actinomycetota bacterium]
MVGERSIRGRIPPIVLALLLLPLLGLATSTARAQDAGIVLTLARQTSFATAQDPVVDLAVTATNTGGTALTDLSIGLLLGTEVRTRGDEQLSMDPAVPLTSLDSETRAQEGSLEPGQTRTFATTVDLTAFHVSQTESLIYPLSVDLRSRDSVLAELRTPVLFFFQTPVQPLSFAWTIELAPPITFAPDGSFADDTIEGAIAPGGRIAEQVSSLRTLANAGTAANVVLSPVLVDTLQRMASGYVVGERRVPAGHGGAAAAQQLLASLHVSLHAPAVVVSAYPFAAPQLPSLLRSGLSRDLDLQIDRGRDLVGSALDLTPSSAVARAPEGELDENTMQRLAADGATTLLVDAGTIERPAQPKDFAPPPTASIDLPGGGDPMTLVLPDPGTQAVLASDVALADPVLASQQALGSLAAVWQEQPVPDAPRGVAVSLTEDLGLPAGFWDAFTRRIETAPFLEPVNAEELVSRIPPAVASDLPAASSAVFPSEYVGAIHQERRRIDALRSVLPGDVALADELSQDLLYAEAGVYLSDPDAGRRWIDAVDARTQTVFSRATPASGQAFTLASGSTAIPLLMPGSEGPPLTVQIELQSSQLRFPDGAVQTATIDGEDRSLVFQVQATGAGQVPLVVFVRAPNGRILSESRFVVRSTAFNRIALAITAAAALALVALWLRRLVARRRTA